MFLCFFVQRYLESSCFKVLYVVYDILISENLVEASDAQCLFFNETKLCPPNPLKLRGNLFPGILYEYDCTCKSSVHRGTCRRFRNKQSRVSSSMF